MGDPKILSDLAKSIWQVLVDRHSGAGGAIPRERLYRFISSWDEYRNVRGGKPVSFRAFRKAKEELVRHRFRVGSGPKGWYRIVTAADAWASAAYLLPHYKAILADVEMLNEAARDLEAEEKPATTKKIHIVQPQELFPPEVFKEDGTENILKRAQTPEGGK